MSVQFDAPLSDDEMIELDTFLLSADEGDERLSLDEAHGFITALIVSHDQSTDQDEWLEFVWGRPAFADDEEKQRMTALMQRMHHEIASTLQAHQYFEPLVVEIEEDDELLVAHEGWCFGFMLAVSKDEERWSQLPKDEQALLAPIAKLALAHVEEEEPDLDDEECEMLAELVPGAVKGLYSYWETHSA